MALANAFLAFSEQACSAPIELSESHWSDYNVRLVNEADTEYSRAVSNLLLANLEIHEKHQQWQVKVLLSHVGCSRQNQGPHVADAIGGARIARKKQIRFLLRVIRNEKNSFQNSLGYHENRLWFGLTWKLACCSNIWNLNSVPWFRSTEARTTLSTCIKWLLHWVCVAVL